MIEVHTKKGYTFILDDEDADLAELRWTALEAPNGRVYATRIVGPKTSKRKAIYLHRMVMERTAPIPPKAHTDHKNGNTLDTRRENIRVVTARENARNLGGARPKSPSQYLGVSFRKELPLRPWQARIRVDGKRIHLGYFSTPEEANGARLEAEARLWGIQPRRAAAHAS